MDFNDIKMILDQQGEEFKARFSELATRVDELQLKAARPGGFTGMAGNDPLTGGQRKSLAEGVRALLVGNDVAAYRHFGEAKAMSVGTDPEGGYLVIPVMSPSVERVMLETSPLLNEVRVVTLDASDEWEEVVDTEEAEAVWVGETQTRNDTATPGLKKVSVPLHEIYALPKVTQKLIDTTSFDVVGWLSEKIGEKFGNSIGAAIAAGNGIAKPTGFLSYPTLATGDATRAWGKLQHVPTGTSGAFASSNPTDVLDDTVAQLKTQYRQGAKWFMARTTASTISKLKDSTGQRIWQQALTEGQPPMLLGYPVVIDDNLPAIGANSLSIAFGNMRRAYTMLRRLGIRFLTDPYTEKPHVKLFAYQRCGGGLINTEAVKLVRFGTS